MFTLKVLTFVRGTEASYLKMCKWKSEHQEGGNAIEKVNSRSEAQGRQQPYYTAEPQGSLSKAGTQQGKWRESRRGCERRMQVMHTLTSPVKGSEFYLTRNGSCLTYSIQRDVPATDSVS